MSLTVGYMVTWGTYGGWLQGDRRGCADSSKMSESQYVLNRANKKNLVGRPVRFDIKAKAAVAQAICDDAVASGEKIAALAVCSNHVHVVVRNRGRDAVEFVGRSKAAGRRVLKPLGFAGKVWAKKYDLRFCFSEEEFDARVKYVQEQAR